MKTNAKYIKEIAYLGISTLVISGSPTFAMPATDLSCSQCVDNSEIQVNTITSSRIAAGAVNNSDIASNAVTTQKIQNFTIRASDLASASVTSGKIKNGDVQNIDLADNAVTTGKIASGAVTNSDIATSAITSSKIAPGAVGNSDIATSAITTAKIATGGVTNTDIANGAVSESKLSASVAGKLNNTPGIEYNQQTGIGTLIQVTSTWTSVKTLTMTLPASGYVFCTATGHVRHDNVLSNGQVNLGWDMDSGSTTPDSFNRYQASGLSTNGGDPYMNLSATYTYFVGAGTRTFYLKTNQGGGGNTDFDLYVPNATCMYFPKRY